MAPSTQSKVKKTIDAELIMEPRQEDILCGKEKHCVSHPGSINFRAVIDKFASKYQDAITKQEKMNVTKEIYESLGSQNSRFLKFNAKAEGWEQLTSLLARDKISHALRFANREKKASPSSSTTKPKSKKGHRRTGSDSSNTTLSTVATELSLDDFEDMMLDSEPLDWEDEDKDDKPYAYEIPFDSMPSMPAPAPVYPQHSYSQQYYHQSAYSHPPQPYYHSHHYHSYPQYAPAPGAPHHHQAEHHYTEPQYQSQIQCHNEDTNMAAFPEKQASEPLARENSMEVDLSYIMSEPLIEWDPQTDAVYTVNEQETSNKC